MIDPIPENFTTLTEAVARLTKEITDREIEAARRDVRRRSETLGYPPEEQSAATVDARPYATPRDEDIDNWTKRELAIQRLYSALLAGSVIAYVGDPDAGEFFRLESSDWRGSAFWEHTIRGGVIHASARESIERHDGRRVLIEDVEFGRWLAAERRPKPARNSDDCLSWLEQEMRASPDQKPKPKREWLSDAKAKFDISRRQFERIWDSAMQNTGASWNRPGAPRKSSR